MNWNNFYKGVKLTFGSILNFVYLIGLILVVILFLGGLYLLLSQDFEISLKVTFVLGIFVIVFFLSKKVIFYFERVGGEKTNIAFPKS